LLRNSCGFPSIGCELFIASYSSPRSSNTVLCLFVITCGCSIISLKKICGCSMFTVSSVVLHVIIRRTAGSSSLRHRIYCSCRCF
jgi:hypothetical protein